ncbi:hypothetical protein E4U02_14830, partial [Microbacterium paludicola]
MNKRRLLLAAAALVAFTVVVIGALTSPSALLVALGALLIGAIVLLIDTRTTLSARIASTARKLERNLLTARPPRPAAAP